MKTFVLREKEIAYYKKYAKSKGFTHASWSLRRSLTVVVTMKIAMIHVMSAKETDTTTVKYAVVMMKSPVTPVVAQTYSRQMMG